MRSVLCAAAFLLSGASMASAATVDFEDLPVGSLGSSATIGGMTFASPVDLFVGQYFTADGVTNALCSRSAGAPGCESDLTVTFAVPVSMFSLVVDGANTIDAEITARALLSDGSLKTIVFNGFQPFTPKTLVFGEPQEIRSVTFSTTDPQGFSFDDFTFSSGGVPEPASWAMLIAGFGIVGGSLRRRRPAATSI